VNAPVAADFKAYFFRDFPYGKTLETVTDADITNAIQMASYNFNADFWPDQPLFTLGYLLLSAHYLVLNLRGSSQGIAGQYSWLQTSKSVGSVSEGLQVPDRILANPLMAMYSKTTYGAKYLELVLPMLTGQIYTALGDTKA
jgi:hypothetical protein